MAALTLETGTVGRVALSCPEMRDSFNRLQWRSMLLRSQNKSQSSAFHLMAWLCIDNMIDLADSRRLLALGLSASHNASISKSKFGLFRI